ncbi:MAG TPA: hypothetical protein VLI05_00430 [Candidatus Saccharimonadia bacterium]|nr:hypothetical protein [Candidatus Saccharimonadia bacterium]
MTNPPGSRCLAHITLAGDESTGKRDVKFDYLLGVGVLLPGNVSFRIHCADGVDIELRIRGEVVYDLDKPELDARVLRVENRRLSVTEHMDHLQTNPNVRVVDYQPLPRPGARHFPAERGDASDRALGSGH